VGSAERVGEMSYFATYPLFNRISIIGVMANLVKIITKVADRYFELTRFLQFVVWLLLILALKCDTLLEPPVWDAAMGAFPPAIFLYETNFNVLELVKQTDWWEGGANGRHSFSLWTWYVAIVMTLTGNSLVTFATLHLTTFVINAVAISVFVRVLFQYRAAPCLALISGFFLLITPLVLVQIGYIYTESLVMSFGILAWASWHHKREGSAVLFVLLAMSIKLTGVVIALCIGPLLLLRLLNRFSYKRLLLLISIPLTLWFLISIDGWLGELPPTHGMDWGSQELIFNALKAKLKGAYETKYLTFIGMLAAIYYVYCQWRLNAGAGIMASLKRPNYEIESRFIALVFTFLFLLGIIALSFQGSLYLYRYAIPMVPFAIVQLVLLAQLLKHQKVILFTFLFGCVFSIYNHNGALYRASSSFPAAERTHAYQAYYRAQKTIINELGKLDDEVPIYVSREIDYLTSHPMMGYVERIKPNIKGVYKPRYNKKSLEDFPGQFYAVVSISWHGGERLKSLIAHAKRSEEWKVDDVYEQKAGGYEMFIKRVSRVPGLKSTL
jgi:hypothetical protein